MKKITLRIASLLAVLALLSALAVPASAAKPEFMLALGDSITTGYGLDGYAETDPYECASYTNIVAEALGLEAKSAYVNKAVNGATSADLLKLLPDVENYLGYSDLVVVTIGGNDLLQSVSIIASAVAGKSVSGLSASIDVLSAAGPEKFAALSSNTSFQSKMGAVLATYATNLAATAKIIKEYADKVKTFEIKGGFIDGEVIDVAKVEALAATPSKPVLVCKIMGSMMSPLYGLAYALQAIIDKSGEAPAEEAAEVAAE